MTKLKIILILIVVTVFSVTIVADPVASVRPMLFSLQIDIAPGMYLARYRIGGKRPECFEDVDYFMLSNKRISREEVTYDAEGNALVSGGRLHTTDSKDYKFTTAKLVRSGRIIHGERGFFEHLIFATESIEGVSYSFEGEFLSQPEEIETGDFIHLKGVLTRLKDGQKIGEAKLRFIRLGKE